MLYKDAKKIWTSELVINSIWFNYCYFIQVHRMQRLQVTRASGLCEPRTNLFMFKINKITFLGHFLRFEIYLLLKIIKPRDPVIEIWLVWHGLQKYGAKIFVVLAKLLSYRVVFAIFNILLPIKIFRKMRPFYETIL